MSAADLLRQARADGLTLRATDRGTLKVSGDPAAVDRWVPRLKAHKPELLHALTAGTMLERRRAFVVRELQEHAELRVSTHVQDAPLRPEPGEPISVMVAVRTKTSEIVSAEFLIPRERFDFVLFTKMLAETSARPS